ncbi:MAG: hypothetical protein V7647_3976 [Acidobacteriota bacterium]
MRVRLWVPVVLVCATAGVIAAVPPVLEDNLAGRQVFSSSNWWNTDVTGAPVDPRSLQLIDFISGRTATNRTPVRRLHPDFGPPPYGIPYVVVAGDQPRVALALGAYADESDTGAPGLPGYPMPVEARTTPNYIEGGVAGGGSIGDRHMLVIDRDRWLLYETYATHWNGAQWEADSAAVFDLSRSDRRPEGWTSADAAGLAIFPGLVRYDETFGTAEITHAFRVTTRATNGYVWPASHSAGATAGAPPMGARLRLKATRDVSAFTPEVQRIFRAMKRYGLIVADNGSDMYVSGSMDGRWNNSVLNPAFSALTADDFEVVQFGWLGAAPLPPTNLRILR